MSAVDERPFFLLCLSEKQLPRETRATIWSSDPRMPSRCAFRLADGGQNTLNGHYGCCFESDIPLPIVWQQHLQVPVEEDV